MSGEYETKRFLEDKDKERASQFVIGTDGVKLLYTVFVPEDIDSVEIV